jgi:glyoxylase I family protein
MRIMRIHHIAMRTRRVEALESFYAGLLGLLQVQRDGQRSVWLRAGESIVMIEQAEDGEPPLPAGSLELVAFAVTLEELDHFRVLLAEQHVPIEAETAYTIYFRDPDGRRIGLSHFPGERVGRA